MKKNLLIVSLALSLGLAACGVSTTPAAPTVPTPAAPAPTAPDKTLRLVASADVLAAVGLSAHLQRGDTLVLVPLPGYSPVVRLNGKYPFEGGQMILAEKHWAVSRGAVLEVVAVGGWTEGLRIE